MSKTYTEEESQKAREENILKKSHRKESSMAIAWTMLELRYQGKEEACSKRVPLYTEI